jgi:hypothetical protein
MREVTRSRWQMKGVANRPTVQPMAKRPVCHMTTELVYQLAVGLSLSLLLLPGLIQAIAECFEGSGHRFRGRFKTHVHANVGISPYLEATPSRASTAGSVMRSLIAGTPSSAKSLVLIVWSPSDWRQSTASGAPFCPSMACQAGFCAGDHGQGPQPRSAAANGGGLEGDRWSRNNA